MAEPARKIRNVETTDDVARPRDAAIRQALNDNQKNYTRYTSTEKAPANLSYENDTEYSAYPTVNESFNEYASERTIQSSSNAGSAIRSAKVEYQKRTAPQVTRQSTSVTRSVATTKGRPRVGKPSVKNMLPNVPVLDVNPAKLARATTISVSNLSWGIGLWLSIQLPLAIMAAVLLGATYVIKDVIPGMIKDVTGELIYNGLSYIYSSLSDGIGWLTNKLFGVDLTALADPSGYFVLTNFLVFIIGFATLMLMGIIYQVSLINCVFGKHTTLKISTLIFATFAYMVPLLNIIPWFIFWVLVVWRYPE